MEPMEAALFLSAITDVVFRLGAGTTDMTPEEFTSEMFAVVATLGAMKLDNMQAFGHCTDGRDTIKFSIEDNISKVVVYVKREAFDE